MNIEESTEYLKNCLNDEYNFKNATRKKDKEAIGTLLTAYEKEKEKVDARESVILDKEKEITKLNNEIYEFKKRIRAINLLSYEEE